MTLVAIPTLILKQLYTFGSLENTAKGVQFAIKNRLSDAQLTSLQSIKIDGQEVPAEALEIHIGEEVYTPAQISSATPLDFPLGRVLHLVAKVEPLASGKHEIEFNFDTSTFGALAFGVEDGLSAEPSTLTRIPRQPEDDYSDSAIRERQRFVEKFSGATLKHISKFSFDPQATKGNIEHLSGVAQIPLGFAGPIIINGEHAKGEFIVPMATTEGTLVASYNRGIKVLNLSGGATCTVMADAMQRAPVFEFEDARGARDFLTWVNQHYDKIKEEAEATSSIAKLQNIDPYLSNKFAYLRFNYSTGDAAGQNMVGRATFAACSWALDNYDGAAPIKHFYLESNFATDKKASQVNIMRTRGKRVTAEAVIKRDVLQQHMRVDPESLYHHSHIANVGAFMSGANNNGCHSPNAITAIFIATGQDVANVSESSAAIVYTELTKERDLYLSITIPSLIVATYGGGTGLATQRECLEILGCYGRNGVHKFAEIVAGVVLAGEISLAAAISSSDWVSSHEKYGRNR